MTKKYSELTEDQKEKRRANHRRWWAKHIEAIREYDRQRKRRAWADSDFRSKKRAYMSRNRHIYNKAQSLYRLRNPDKVRESNRVWNVRLRTFRHTLAFLARMEKMSEALMDQATSEVAEVREELKNMSTESLKSAFANGLRVTRSNLVRLAAILYELEARGEIVEGDLFFLKMLRQIGSGELLVGVVVRFAGRPYTMASIAKMPVEDQQKFLEMPLTEVEETFKNRKKKKVARTYIPEDHDEVESPVQFAAKANPRDLADTIIDMINSSESPLKVAQLVLPHIKAIVVAGS